MRDMHIHTEFSCDSEAKMEDYMLEAKKKVFQRFVLQLMWT